MMRNLTTIFGFIYMYSIRLMVAMYIYTIATLRTVNCRN